jgi:uncharacterized membrane protein
MTTLSQLIPIIIFIHLLSAVILIGGSLFIWIIVYPVSKLFYYGKEKERLELMRSINRRFAPITHISVATLLITGFILGYWYNGYSFNFNSIRSALLIIKIVISLSMIMIMYFNNIQHKKKRYSRKNFYISMITLALMIAILFISSMMQFY